MWDWLRINYSVGFIIEEHVIDTHIFLDDGGAEEWSGIIS